MLQHFGKVATVDHVATGRAFNVVVGLVGRRPSFWTARVLRRWCGLGVACHGLPTLSPSRCLARYRPAAMPDHECATGRSHRSQDSDNAGGFPTMVACRAGLD